MILLFENTSRHIGRQFLGRVIELVAGQNVVVKCKMIRYEFVKLEERSSVEYGKC
jgi:hypothetical protein